MQTTTTLDAPVEFSPVIERRTENARKAYNRLAGWLTKVDTYIADGRTGTLTGRPPGKQVKGWMYDDLYWTARALGQPQAESLIGAHRLLTAAKAAGHLSGTIKPVPASVIAHMERWEAHFGQEGRR